MDKIIKASKFVHNNEDENERFEDEVNQWSSSNVENCTPEDSKKALSALADKLTEKKIPDYETQGWEQAKCAFDQCHQIAVYILENGKAQASSFHTIYYDFILRLMEYGPGTIHMYIVRECLEDVDMELMAHIKTLQEEKVNRLVKALLKEVKILEKVSEEDFYDKYQRYVSKFVSDTFSDEQLQQHKKTFMDYFVHCTLDFFYLNEECCNLMAEAGDSIYSRYDNAWKTFGDIESLKSYIKKCNDIFKDPKFPQHDAAKTVTRRFLDNMSEELGKQGLVVELSVPFIDLIISISKCSCDDEDYQMRCFTDALDFFSRLPDTSVKKKPEVFQVISKRYASAILELDMKFLDKKRFATTIMDVLVKAYANDAKLSKEWVQLMIPLFQRPCTETMSACSDIAREKKSVKWQDYPEVAEKVAAAISTFKIPDIDEDDDEEVEKAKRMLDSLKNITENFLEGLKKAKLMSKYAGHMLQLTLSIIEMKKEYAYELAEEMAKKTEIDIKSDKEIVIKAMKRLLAIMKNDDYPWNESWTFQRALESVATCCAESVKDVRVLTDEDLRVYISVCYSCQQHDPLNHETGDIGSTQYLIFLSLIHELVKWLCSLNKCDLAAELIPGIIKTYELEHTDIYRVNSTILVELGQATSGQKLLASYVDDLIKIYLKTDDSDLLRSVDQLYPFNPKPMTQHYRVLMDTMQESADQSTTVWLCQLFHKVSKKQPELFTEKDALSILTKARNDQSNQPTLLMILQELGKRRPEIMVKHIDPLTDSTGLMPMLLTWMNELLCSIALYKKEVAPKVLDYLLKSAKTNQDYANLYTSLNSTRQIGFKYPEIIKPKRAEIVNIKIQDPNGLELKKTIVDMIDGKTPDDLRKQLEQQQTDITDLVGRVEDTEEAVVEVNGKVDEQRKQLDTVKNDVGEQGQRLDKVEVTVDETVIKVEEIDSKTLSHAPYWSRDVSKLLNPKSDHDWTLLASRLGYSNDDIRAWAQQSDPCMAMLNEWYATRKTSEATHAILTQLQEMNRMDAAIIVENAMKNAEAVVEDEDFDYAEPPAVFISYQWGHQEEVRLLQKHLDMAGYDCWLDIGQMGGGDKLFEKIDKGIRAAKVIISCVTDKYSKSPNCNREVNLSVNLNKPIIPLLMEKCTWPPPGSMGPIFSEYLFIRFFQRGGEELPDQRFWPEGKFQELLMQLNMFGLPPDENKVEPVYRDWWMPVVEEIKIDKNKTKNGGQVSKVEAEKMDEKAAVSPDVFISYQWGKQKNIIKLYERLTSLGLTCWLDIKQMGGGDSLYDKIDRGIRGCKVMLSCVTTKYALSANCRREFSLADALQKPLIPLKLETMNWPPTGPMGVVLAQLLYIDFTKDETVQMTWDGSKFDELLHKINGYVPVSLMNQSQDNDKENEGTKNQGSRSEEKQKDVRFQKEEKQKIEKQRDAKLEEEKKEQEKRQKEEHIIQEEKRLKELENQKKQEKEAKESVKAEKPKLERKVDKIEKEEPNTSTNNENSVRKAAPADAASSVKSTKSAQSVNKAKPKAQESGPKPPPSQQAKEARSQWRPSPTPNQSKAPNSSQKSRDTLSSKSQTSRDKSPQPPRSQQSSASSNRSPKPPPSQQSKVSEGSVPSQAFKSAQRPRPSPAASPSPTKQQQKSSQPSSKAQQESKSPSPPKKQEISSPSNHQQQPVVKEAEASPQQHPPPKKSSTCSVI